MAPTTAGPEVGRGRADRAWLGFAFALVVVPIAIAAGRAVVDSWYPASDDAVFSLRALDVFSTHPPLLGTWSSGSGWSGTQFNHPGPLLFYLLAAPVRLFGFAAGTAIGTAVVNVLAVVAVIWLARRRAGAVFALATAAAVAGLEWSMGAPLLYDPWNPNAATLPFCALLFAAWSVIDGDWVALPVMVLAGSLALQLHLSYVILVPVVVVAAVGGAAVLPRRWRARAGVGPVGSAVSRAAPNARRWVVAAVALAVVTWLPPLWQQATGHPGNVTALVDARGHGGPDPIGLLRGLRTVAAVVAVPPAWFPPGWDRPAFETVRLGRARSFEVPAAAGVVALAVVVALLAGAAWAARRDRRSTSVAGCGLGLVALVAGVASASQAASAYDSIESYVRWLWPIALFCWLQLVLVAVPRALRWVHHRRPALGLRLRTGAAGLAAVVGLVGAIGALGGSAAGSGSIPWARAPSRGAADAAWRLRGRGPLLIHQHLDIGGDAIEPSVLVTLVRAGVPFYVDEDAMAHQVGTHRRYTGQPAVRTEVWFASGDAALDPVPAGAQRVFLHRGLGRADEARFRELRGELVRAMRERGLTLSTRGRKLERLAYLAPVVRAIRQARRDPMQLLGGFTPSTVVTNDMVDASDPLWPSLVAYAPLAMRWNTQTVAMFVAPLGTPGAPAPNPPGTKQVGA